MVVLLTQKRPYFSSSTWHSKQGAMRWVLCVACCVAAVGAKKGSKSPLSPASAFRRDLIDKSGPEQLERIKKLTAHQIECAGCEAVAQELEAKMTLGLHLGKASHKRAKAGVDKKKGGGSSLTDLATGSGGIERLDVLYSLCAGMLKYVPALLPTTDSMHFTKTREPPQGVTNDVYLSTQCDDLVEEHEDALLEVVRTSEPNAAAIKMGLKDMPKYELKQAVCVEATQKCTDESLMAISQGRINLMKDMEPSAVHDLVSKASASGMMGEGGGGVFSQPVETGGGDDVDEKDEV